MSLPINKYINDMSQEDFKTRNMSYEQKRKYLEDKKKEKQNIKKKTKKESQKIIAKYNALSAEEKQKIVEFLTILREDDFKTWIFLSKRKKKKRWSKVFRKQWWQFWIEVPDLNIDYLLNIKY